MRLVKVSGNVFVNPDRISCIEQREVGGTYATYVWVDSQSYVLTIPFEEFYSSLNADQDGSGNSNGQYWAG